MATAVTAAENGETAPDVTVIVYADRLRKFTTTLPATLLRSYIFIEITASFFAIRIESVFGVFELSNAYFN